MKSENFIQGIELKILQQPLVVIPLRHGCMYQELMHETVMELYNYQRLLRNPGFDSRDKISRFHHKDCDVLADNSTTSLVCILRHFLLRPHRLLWVTMVGVRHDSRTSSCRAGSPYGILPARNRKYPPKVGYPGYSLPWRMHAPLLGAGFISTTTKSRSSFQIDSEATLHCVISKFPTSLSESDSDSDVSMQCLKISQSIWQRVIFYREDPAQKVFRNFKNHTWKSVAQNLDLFKTGGLVKKMSEEWQAWDCSVQHPCSLDTNDWVCFTYSEEHAFFVPWGSLKLTAFCALLKSYMFVWAHNTVLLSSCGTVTCQYTWNCWIDMTHF